MKKRISLTIEEDLLRKIDKKRKLIPRSTYINNILKKKKEEWKIEVN